jgi:hypothetical protein
MQGDWPGRERVIGEVPRSTVTVSLIKILRESRVIRCPHQLGDPGLQNRYFAEAADLLVAYYNHPNITIPEAPTNKPRTQQEYAAWLALRIRACCYGELVRARWLAQDERTKVIVVTPEARQCIEALTVR